MIDTSKKNININFRLDAKTLLIIEKFSKKNKCLCRSDAIRKLAVYWDQEHSQEAE